ncbi:MAG: methylated-DNA--[protein]-cysteine S-methyltransferase [Alcaligenes aquatilis]
MTRLPSKQDRAHRYREAEQFLAALDPDWQALVTHVGPCIHQPRPERDPYEALIRSVVYQQLHTRAAERILQRLIDIYPHGHCPTPEQVLATPYETLRACGLSGAKANSILGLAQARLDGIIPDQATALQMPDEELIKQLTTLRGIGRWTVEIMMMYTLEHEDILPADDFGVREGYRHLKRLDKAPSARALRDIGQAWAPYRSVASWYLWRMPKHTPAATPAPNKVHRSQRLQAKTPRPQGPGKPIRFAITQSSLGALMVAESERGICAIALGDDPNILLAQLQDRFKTAELIGADSLFNQRVAQVLAMVEEPTQGLDLPLDIQGTAFQQRVWEFLRQIPAGQTLSYTELAKRLNMPNGARAVARACASNILAIAIPCHRVLRQSGDLAGYRWGLERKKTLLERERAQ